MEGCLLSLFPGYDTQFIKLLIDLCEIDLNHHTLSGSSEEIEIMPMIVTE